MELQLALRNSWRNMIVNKIIFLDIDGVLNSNSFTDNDEFIDLFCKVHDGSMKDIVAYKMLEVSMDKIFLLRDICTMTGAKIVISSGWRRLWNWPLLEEKLVSLGLPIVGVTPHIDGIRRGEEIRTYLWNQILLEDKVDNFVILDDDIFPDFNELENYLIKTSFYEDGLTEEISNDVVRILRRV